MEECDDEEEEGSNETEDDSDEVPEPLPDANYLEPDPFKPERWSNK